MVAGPNGTAKSSVGNNTTTDNADTFAIALESSSDEGVKMVECLIL
jgi:predicted ABC-type ATPase